MFSTNVFGVWDMTHAELVTPKVYCQLMRLRYGRHTAKLLYFREQDAKACAKRLDKATRRTSRFVVAALYASYPYYY